MNAKQLTNFEGCGYIKISEQLAHMCKPYRGCPRGSVGADGWSGNSAKESLIFILKSCEKLQIKSADDTFICIPMDQYEMLFSIIRKINDACLKVNSSDVVINEFRHNKYFDIVMDASVKN